MRLRAVSARPFLRSGAVLALSLVLLGATPATGSATSSTFMRWKFASDLRAHPNQNPVPSSFGHPAAWSLRQSQSLKHDGNYALLRAYSSTFGAAGLKAWHGDRPGSCVKLPAIGVNITTKSLPLCTGKVPDSAAFVLPAATRMPVVAWTSPYEGTVTISHDAVADLDRTCGDGVNYYVDLGTTRLSTVILTNGGSTMLPSMNVPIHKGQSLYFIVDPGPRNNIRCDATQVQVTIDGVVTQA